MYANYKLWSWTQNFSLSNWILLNEEKLSKIFYTNRFLLKSHGLPSITFCLSSCVANVTIKIFDPHSYTGVGLLIFHIFVKVEANTSLPMIRSEYIFPPSFYHHYLVFQPPHLRLTREENFPPQLNTIYFTYLEYLSPSLQSEQPYL